MRWRGYDDKKQRRGNDAGSSIKNVEDDSRKKDKKAKTLDPRSEPVLDVCNRGSGMTDKDKRRTQRHEMARLQETRQKPWIPSLTGSPIKNVGDKRRG